MSNTSSGETILSQAKERERDYDWMGSVGLYSTALGMVSGQDVVKAGEIHERIGYGLFRAAMQADSVEEFKERMRMSVESYEKATKLFEKVETTRGLYCRALARYSDSWLIEDPSQKKRLLDDCWRLMKEALARFDAAGDNLGYGKAFHSLSFCLWDSADFVDDWREIERIVDEATRCGQKAIEKLSKTGDLSELAWAYTMTSLIIVHYVELFFWEGRKEFASIISDYLEKALGLSEKIEDAYLYGFLYATLCWSTYDIAGDSHAALKYGEKSLQQSERSNDHFLLGLAYFLLNYVTVGASDAEENPEKMREKVKVGMRFAEDSIRHSLLVCRYDRVSWGYSYYLVGSYYRLAELETSFEGKQDLLERSVEVGRKGAEYAQRSSSPMAILMISDMLSKAIFFLSQIETSISEKNKLLEEALELREKCIKISNHLIPSYEFMRGVFEHNLALIKADLAKLEESEEKKRYLLEEAVSSMERSVELCAKSLQIGVIDPGYFADFGLFHDRFGRILDQLYSLTKDEKLIDRVIGIHQGAAQAYQKAGMPSRVAEALWKAAKLYDRRGEYTEAADNFAQASRNYQQVAENIPQLRDFYQDHALYMQAWGEIEKARHHHARQDYDIAKEHYEKAATIHKSLRQWSYLALNYSAWACVENAEDLSRREQSEEAVQAFEQASKLFTETKASLQTNLGKIENPDEKTMATNLIEAQDLRREYCIGRIALEEARVLDKKGDHYSSSEKYGSAAETFEKITQTLESEQDRKEFRLITTLSRAWQKMTQAEAETSPSVYIEASQLFEEAKELSPSERAKTLALGHSRFCLALEAGTRFVDSGNAALHTTAIQHLGSASKYYVKAGFQNASEYAKATELLLDAYMHIDNAKKENDPEKKARLYIMAEKVLQTSADAFTKTEHLEKKEQVLRLLKEAREERELAVSLSEVLHAPSIVSATTAFVTPTPTQENAVGLERFEHAHIQANVTTRRKDLTVGENLDLEIELANAGKFPALLVRIEQIIPNGFELKEKPETYRVEDSYLNMKGKRLDPLKSEEIKLVLKPKAQGVFSFKPKILYLDENGESKSHQTEPISITVKELGIKGWIRGGR